jgi:Protein of unknown function (DUF3891)
MIRREVGNEFFLITQHDHALLAGQLAQQYGNERFDPPSPREATITGVAMHDSGWPLHDDLPTLNAKHLPLDVFESPRAIALKVWTASAERAAAVDPYAGLLVSLHSLALSIYATSQVSSKNDSFDVSQLAERFEVNKFQHREVERQENLRKMLGLRTDIPLTHGLAEPRASADEDRLTHNFRILQAMDLISLCACCSTMPAFKTQDILPRAGGTPIHLKLHRHGEDSVILKPWPFDVARIDLAIPFRRIPAQSYPTEEEFRRMYASATVDTLPVTVIS